MQIKNKVAIVTGAGQGIGKAVSEAILQKEGKVVLSDIDSDFGQKTLEEFKSKYGNDSVTFFKCDVSNKAEQRDLFQYTEKTFGRIDIVCNNAGVMYRETLDNFDKIIDINLKGAIIGTMLALEYMKSGVIINTASGAGLETIPLANVYGASKYGIVGYTKSTAANPDIVGGDIRLNVACPMLVNTRLPEAYAGTKVLNNFIEKYGVLEPPRVAEGFIRLIEDDTLHGTALKITERYGFELC